MKNMIFVATLLVAAGCSDVKSVGRGAATSVGRNVAVDESKAGRLPDGGLIGKVGDGLTNAQNKILGTDKNDGKPPNNPISATAQALGDAQLEVTHATESVLPGGVPKEAEEKYQKRQEERKQEEEVKKNKDQS